MKGLFILISLLFCMAGNAVADTAFTQADRDRIIRIEVRLDEGLKTVNLKVDDGLKSVNLKIDDGLKAVNLRIDDTNKRIDDLNRRIDDLKGLSYVIIGGIFTLIGFVIWDRHTTLKPVVTTVRELEKRFDRFELAIKEKAESDPILKEALRHAGLL
ncbi:MAG: hypothetical protein HQK99_12785 [Nitrospirae bacterium]|nr:hypothetical protein [Nitrospirota bacterium]